jgi:hypothetical protein
MAEDDRIDISLLMPTRGRPAKARRFLDSVAAHTSRLDTIEVVTYVDEDDPESHELQHDRVRLTKIIGPSTTMGAHNLACLHRASGQIIVLVNDDVVIRTSGWDERLREADRRFADRIYLAYGNDLFKRQRIATFPILSRRACQILGEPYSAAYKGGLIDYHLFDIFKRLERLGHSRIAYLSSVVFEHLHYRTGKAPYDDTYRRRGRWDDDPTFMMLAGDRQASAERLADAIGGPVTRPRARVTPPHGCPETTAAAIRLFAQAFLADSGLPVGWRVFLFTWYCGRFVASRQGASRPAANRAGAPENECGADDRAPVR